METYRITYMDDVVTLRAFNEQFGVTEAMLLGYIKHNKGKKYFTINGLIFNFELVEGN